MKKISKYFLISAVLSTSAVSEQLIVKVKNISSNQGQIGCALFSSPDGFPMDASKAIPISIEANSAGVTCEFSHVEKGTYAVAVNHDANGNNKTDTNFFGTPKEDWGVSNNIRPAMRAPTFEEAAFTIDGNTTITVEVK